MRYKTRTLDVKMANVTWKQTFWCLMALAVMSHKCDGYCFEGKLVPEMTGKIILLISVFWINYTRFFQQPLGHIITFSPPNQHFLIHQYFSCLTASLHETVNCALCFIICTIFTYSQLQHIQPTIFKLFSNYISMTA